MYKITWDKETGGIQLNLRVAEDTLSVAPRPVFFEELDLLKMESHTAGRIHVAMNLFFGHAISNTFIAES